MPKTPSNKLFKLVKSLTGSEKRHFKIYINARSNQDTHYVKLFDLLEAQITFDDHALKTSIYGSVDIEGRKYSELKAYLYDLILKSLISFDDKNSVEYRLKGMLLSIKTLFKRSHFNDCKELLQKTYKLARKHEQFQTLLEVLDWEKRIAYATLDLEYIGKNLRRIDREEQECLDQLRLIRTYRNIFLRLLMTLRQDVIRKEKIKERIDEIMIHPLLKEPSKISSFKAQIMLKRINAFYHYAISDIKKYYDTNKELVALMESKPLYLKEDISEYISVLSNLAVSCGNLGKLDEVEENLRKLLALKPQTHDDQLKIYRQYYALKLPLCRSKGAFTVGVSEIELIPKRLSPEDQKIFEKDSFYFSFFYIYFGVGAFDEALFYLNNWLNIPRSSERQDLQALAKVLNLIIHYEMNNSSLIESILRSTNRYLNKQGLTFEFERKITAFFAKVTRKAMGKKERKAAFIQLKYELENNLTSTTEQKLLTIFDIISWIDSKTSNKSFAQVVQEKFEEKYS